MIQLKKVTYGTSEFDELCAIRQKVFVEEQEVDPKEEFDDYEASSVHFLCVYDNQVAGTCRYRKTSKGYKLERFAVLKEYRRKGVGLRMVQACLNEIEKSEKIYLHAQLDAIPLYKKAGFKEFGPLFYECEIAHYAMEYKP